MSKPKSLYASAGISLLGFGLAIYQTIHFYAVRNGTSGFKSLCNISEKFNCDAVAASSYAELIYQLPISSFAAGWFLAFFFVSLFALNPYWRREAVRAMLGLSLGGALISLVYLLIMHFKLHTVCLLCLGTDALVFSLLGLTLSLKPEGISKHPLEWAKWKVLLGFILVSVGATVPLLRLFDQSNIPDAAIRELADRVLNTPVMPIHTDRDSLSIGPKNAPITVVEFSDFQCPYCRLGAFTVQSVLSRYPDKVRVIFRNFPLDQACNSAMNFTSHPAACEAAKVVICAEKQGQFQDVYEALFEKQATLAPGRPSAIAQELGLKMDALKACMDSAETATSIQQDVTEAVTLDVQATPTFYINGHKMEGPYPPESWKLIIDQLLLKGSH